MIGVYITLSQFSKGIYCTVYGPCQGRRHVLLEIFHKCDEPLYSIDKRSKHATCKKNGGTL